MDPRFEEFAGKDAVAYILSTNVARRHLNAGQRAMVTVKANFLKKSEPLTKEMREALAGSANASGSRIDYANIVLAYRDDLADEVIAGTLPLNEAYAQAKDRKNGKDTTEARMTVLEREAPYYANEVREERMTVNEAWAAFPPLVENLPSGDCLPQPPPPQST